MSAMKINFYHCRHTFFVDIYELLLYIINIDAKKTGEKKMTYLNIYTEEKNYTLEIGYKWLSNQSASEIWYSIENLIPSELVDAVVDYKKSKTAKFETLQIDWQPVKNAMRRESDTLTRKVRTSDLLKKFF